MQIDKEQYLQRFTVSKKEEFEFQETGVEMQKHFKENIWPLFYRHPLKKIQDAFQITHERKIYKIRYLIGIMKRLK